MCWTESVDTSVIYCHNISSLQTFLWFFWWLGRSDNIMLNLLCVCLMMKANRKSSSRVSGVCLVSLNEHSSFAAFECGFYVHSRKSAFIWAILRWTATSKHPRWQKAVGGRLRYFTCTQTAQVSEIFSHQMQMGWKIISLQLHSQFISLCAFEMLNFCSEFFTQMVWFTSFSLFL